MTDRMQSDSGLMNQQLFFIHGAGSTSRIWSAVVTQLQDDFQTNCIELPGRSAETTEYNPVTIENYADYVYKAIIERGNNLRKPILVGHSMGGAICQQIALDHPESIAGIVLVTTGARLRISSHFLQQLSDGILDPEFRLKGYSKHTPASIQDEVEDHQSKVPVETALRDFQACNQFDVRELLAFIHTPTLILAGEEDVLTPPRFSQFLHDAISNSKLRIIPHAGHYLPVEQPQTVSEEIRAFAEVYMTKDA